MPWPRCYSLTEQDSVATIRLEPRESADDPEAGQVTVSSLRDGQEEFPPETTPGRLTASTFVYLDGTTLTFDEGQRAWPSDSPLEGAVFVAAVCP